MMKSKAPLLDKYYIQLVQEKWVSGKSKILIKNKKKVLLLINVKKLKLKQRKLRRKLHLWKVKVMILKISIYRHLRLMKSLNCLKKIPNKKK